MSRGAASSASNAQSVCRSGAVPVQNGTVKHHNVCGIRGAHSPPPNRYWYCNTARFLSVRSNCEESVVNVIPQSGRMPISRSRCRHSLLSIRIAMRSSCSAEFLAAVRDLRCSDNFANDAGWLKDSPNSDRSTHDSTKTFPLTIGYWKLATCIS